MNWKTIIGPTAEYEICEDGNVRSLKTGEWRLMKPRVHKIGYYMVCLSYFGKAEKRCIHRLLAEAFLPNPEGKKWVNHKNGIKTDNRLENLEWSTPKENVNHAIDTGLTPTGAKSATSKFSDETIREVFALTQTSGLSQAKIGAMFNMSGSLVSHISLGYRTKHRFIRHVRAANKSGPPIGENHPLSVLTAENVRSIKRELAAGNSAYRVFRRGNYGVSYPTIYSIEKGKTWAHVTI